MDFAKIIVAPKLSKFEWDMQRYHLSPRRMLAKYRREGVDVERIMGSHERQKASLRAFQKIFKTSTYLLRGQITRSAAAKASLVISLGGDNHFQYVSHFVDGTPVVGINSDPKLSEGALDGLLASEYEQLARRLTKDDFEIEEWGRIQVVLNGKKLPVLAVSEVYMGESHRCYMSRHLLEYRGKVEHQKCSGLVIATGAGSTGWYDSACRFRFPKGNRFPKTEQKLCFVACEPYHGKLSGTKIVDGTLKASEVLRVRSLNDTTGILSIDSEHSYPFSEGCHAVLKLALPLRVLKL